MALLLFVPALLLAFGGLVLFFYFFTSIPLPEAVGQQATVVLDADGEEIGTLEADAAREDIPLASLPDHVTGAVLAAEDSSFYEHGGVSFPGIFRAAFVNVVSGRVSQGGSTISQQYIKNVTADSDRTALRKVREAALAVKLERRYEKDEILEYYLNTIYFGRGAYGIQAGARAYFDKDAADLEVAEAALLAGVIPAPSAYDPADSPGDATRRYRYVLGRMVETERLAAAETERLATALPETAEKRTLRFSDHPFFLAHVEKELGAVLGSDEIYRGLTVTTTLDRDAQRSAEAVYADHFSDIEPTGALVSLDPASGAIRALVGGKDYSADQVSMAEARRQPGSTFKAFALAAWIEEGNDPDSWFDAPGQLELDIDAGQPWRVSNYGGSGYGQMTLREATWRSVNTVYAQLALDIGPERIVDLAKRAGIDSPLEGSPSAVLGSEEVTPLELAEGFNSFASGGLRHDATSILSVRRGAQTLYEQDDEAEDDRAFPEDVAWHVTDVLRGVISSGTGTRADIGRPVAGKTGTTQGFGDAWFAGYTRQLTTVVWMGNRDDRERMEGDPTGGGLPATVWADYMREVHEGLPVEDFPEPSGRLEVTRSAPAPTCGEGEQLVDGECVPRISEDAEPAPAEPAPEPAPEPEPEPEPEPAPEPEPEPEPEEPEPEPAPEPDPPASPDPEPGRGEGGGQDNGAGPQDQRGPGDRGPRP